MFIKFILKILKTIISQTDIRQNQKILTFYEKYMIIVGSVGQLLFYLQAFKIFHYGSAKDLSSAGFFIAFLALSSWFLYGVLIRNKVLMFTNAVGAIGAGLVLIGIVWANF